MARLRIGAGSDKSVKPKMAAQEPILKVEEPTVIYVDRPVIEYVDRIVEVPVEKIVEVERIVSVPFVTEIKIVEVEKIVEVPVHVSSEVIRLVPDVAGVNRYKELLIKETNKNKLLKITLAAVILLSIVVGVM